MVWQLQLIQPVTASNYYPCTVYYFLSQRLEVHRNAAAHQPTCLPASQAGNNKGKRTRISLKTSGKRATVLHCASGSGRHLPLWCAPNHSVGGINPNDFSQLIDLGQWLPCRGPTETQLDNAVARLALGYEGGQVGYAVWSTLAPS